MSGFVTDRLSRRGKVWQALVPAVTAFATFGFGLGTAFAGSTTMVALMVVGFEIVNKAYFAPAYGLCVSLMKPGMRGFSMAGLQTLTNLVGAGGGAFVVGYLSDLYGGPESLRYAIATVVFIGVWSAGHFLLAARTLTVDLARAGTH